MQGNGTGRPAGLCAGLVCALALAFAGGASGQTVGGVADVGVDQEPPCLNPYITSCSLNIARRVAGLALPGAFRVQPNLTYQPMLAQSVDVSRNALTYHLKPAAKWNDDTPVSADDLIFTLQTVMNPDNQILDRSGYDLITQAVKIDAKTVRFFFSRPLARWRTLFPYVLPKHILEGKDFDTVWSTFGTGITDPDTGLPVGAGPFLTTSWVLGNRLEMSRNASWWGPHPPYLDSVFFRFLLDTTARVDALPAGTVDLLDEFPSGQAIELYSEPGIVADWYPTGSVEHLMFSTSSTTKPLLQQRWFREALAYAIDRAASLTAVWGTTAPGIGPHHSLVLRSPSPDYQPHFSRYAYSASTVASIMTSNGCALGGDGIWVCAGQRASLRFGTTTGNQARAQMQAQLQAQALAAGIELVIENFAAIELVTRLTARNFDLMMFTFVHGDDPSGHDETWGCGGASNFADYCNPAATHYLKSANSELSPSYRAFLLNRANANLALGVPDVPLFERPRILAYRDELHGVVANPGDPGATWNAEEWYLDP